MIPTLAWTWRVLHRNLSRENAIWYDLSYNQIADAIQSYARAEGNIATQRKIPITMSPYARSKRSSNLAYQDHNVLIRVPLHLSW